MRKQRDELAQERSALRRVSGHEFIEIKVESHCDGTGKNISELDLPPNTNIVSILRYGTVLVPDGSTKILPGDVITALCPSSQIGKIRNLFICHS